MKFYENKEEYLEVVKKIYTIIREKCPSLVSKFTDEKAKEIVNNKDVMDSYLKNKENSNISNRMSQAYVKAAKNIEGFEKEVSKIDHNTYRIYESLCLPGDDEETLKKNEEFLKKNLDPEFRKDIFKDSFNKIFNISYYSKEYKSIQDMAADYASDPATYSLSFVVDKLINNINADIDSELTKKALVNFQGLLQAGGALNSANDIIGSPMSLIFPPDLSVDELAVLVGTIGSDLHDCIKEFSEKYEDFKYTMMGENNDVLKDETIMPYLFTSLSAKEPFEKDNIFKEKLHNELHISNIKDLFFNYHFQDKNGNEVKAVDFVESLVNGNNKVKLVEYTLEEKKEIKEALMSYDERIKKQIKKEELVKDIFNTFRNDDPTGLYSKENEDKFIADIKNKEIISKEAKKIAKRREEQVAYFNKISKGIGIDPGLARSFKNSFEPTLDENKIKEDIDYLKRMSTKEGAIEYTKAFIKKYKDLDFKEAIPKSREDCIKNYDKYNNMLQDAFVIKSMLTNGMLAYSESVKQFMTTFTPAIEGLNVLGEAVNLCSDKLYPYIPEIKESTDPVTLSRLCDTLEKHNDILNLKFTSKSEKKSYLEEKGFKDVRPLDSNEVLNYLSSIEAEKCCNLTNNKMLDAINKGLVSPFIAKDYYVTKNDVVVGLDEYFNNLDTDKIDDYELHQYTPKQKEMLDKDIDNICSKKVEVLCNLFDKKDRLFEYINNILNAKSVFKFTDSGEYNRLTTSINNFNELMQSDKLQSKEAIKNLTEKELTDYVKQVSRLSNDLQEKANDYVEAKMNQKKNDVRQTRFNNSLKLWDLINKEGFNTLDKTTINSVVDTPNIYDKQNAINKQNKDAIIEVNKDVDIKEPIEVDLEDDDFDLDKSFTAFDDPSEDLVK